MTPALYSLSNSNSAFAGHEDIDLSRQVHASAMHVWSDHDVMVRPPLAPSCVGRPGCMVVNPAVGVSSTNLRPEIHLPGVRLVFSTYVDNLCRQIFDSVSGERLLIASLPRYLVSAVSLPLLPKPCCAY